MPKSTKQFFVSLALRAVHVIVKWKPRIIRFFRTIGKPFLWLYRVFIYFAIPVYQLLFKLKKEVSKYYRPAKNKAMFFLTNRYSLHVILIFVVTIVAGLNLGTDAVRAESFGEQSLMFQLVTDQETELVEEYALEGTAAERVSSSYREATGMTAHLGVLRGVDFIGGEVDTATSLVGGGALVSPTVSGIADSVAPRDTVVVHTVEGGDTLSGIATQYGIDVNTLLWANDLSVTSILGLGDELDILPTTGVLHEVRSGDTLSKIVATYDVELDDVLAYNGLDSSTDLQIGQSLIVPGGQIVASAPVDRRTAITSVISTPTVTTPSLAPTTTTSTNITTAPVSSGGMVWPTDLYTITQYYGWGHTGIDVDCYFDNDNYAAAAGIVEFVGWKGGYGYTVDVNHGNGLVTRYAHHASLYVVQGQQVSSGQAVGRCGTTGRSTGTHLHFEVIANGSFKNPLEYIR